MAGRVSIGVIGCGFFSRNHLNSWNDLNPEGADLVAVCDVDGAKAKAAAEAFGVPRWYTDTEAMFAAEKLDLVDIITRMDTHRALAELAFRHKVPAIVQKPFAPEWKDCVAIVKAADKAGLFLAVHENFRFQTPLQKVKAILDSGVIGEPSWARISFRTGYDIYAGQPYFYDEERFVILDLGIHVVDVARYLLGEAERVSCETQKRNPKVKAEDTATIMLRHTSGAVSIVEATYEFEEASRPLPRNDARDRGAARRHRHQARLPHRGHRRRQDDGDRDRHPPAPLGKAALAHGGGERLQDLRAHARMREGGTRGGDVRPRQPQDLRDLRGGLRVRTPPAAR